MRGAAALTTSHGETPAAAPGPSSAFVISISPLSLVDAAITTCWAAQAAAKAPSRASVGRVVGLNALQFAVLAAREGARGLGGVASVFGPAGEMWSVELGPGEVGGD